MLMRSWIDRFITLAVVAALAPVLAGADAVAAENQKKKPVEITSSRLSADNKANTALFEGDVVAKMDGMTMYSDSMKVYYTPERDIEDMDAQGNVKVLKNSNIITSEKAHYMTKERIIIFTGNAKAIEGQNVITGTRITYLMDEDRSLVDDSRVIFDQKHFKQEGSGSASP